MQGWKDQSLGDCVYLLPEASGGNLLCGACVGCRLCCLSVGWREGTALGCVYQEPANALIQKEESAQVSGKENLVLISPAPKRFFHPCQEDMGEDASSSNLKAFVSVSYSLLSKSRFWHKCSRRGSTFLYSSWSSSWDIRQWRKQNVCSGTHLPPPTPPSSHTSPENRNCCVLSINQTAGEHEAQQCLLPFLHCRAINWYKPVTDMFCTHYCFTVATPEHSSCQPKR